MAVSIRTLVSSLPSLVLKKYFEQFPVDFPEAIKWEMEEKELKRIVAKMLTDLPKSAFDPVHVNFERVHTLANENGMRALLNASAEAAELEKLFKGMDNDHHRAMVIFLDKPALFKLAEELLFIDYQAEGRSWNYCALQTDKVLPEVSEVDANAFAFAVANVFYRNYDKPDECCGEVYNRFADGTTQISVYINDMPNGDLLVENYQLRRTSGKKAIVAAILYDPKTKHLATVSKGGKAIHDKIRQSFAKTILKEDTNFTPVAVRQFHIEKFEKRLALVPPPGHGISKVRVRKLDLYATAPHKHILALDTLKTEADSDIYCNKAICDEHGALYKKYSISSAYLTFYFHKKDDETDGRTIHIMLRKDGSDLKNLKEEDRLIIEDCLKLWEIVDSDMEEEEWPKTGTNG
ncbi:MAG: hypothetical protein PHD48_11450 [Alphaproteobacteria bacterium]|nr:hypothetical protein [Alphaproteobacteria bacterium]